MGVRIPEEIIEQIRSQIDILEIVQRYVNLKKSGRNYFGLCPFHNEKSPSFSVSPEKQIYYCFGCQAGGDGIQFLMNLEQMTFIEAITHLAEQMGIHLPKTASGLYEQEDEQQKQMRSALELAAKLFHYLLKSTRIGQQARQYLDKRQLKLETIDEFQIGYAPDSYNFLLGFLKKRGFHEEIMTKAGLVASKELDKQSRYYDRFRDRLMFPIHDSRGRVIGFGGRSLGEKRPKYLNSPETRLFQKGSFLFNFHRARSAIRRKQQVVIFEGYLDVIRAWQAGIYDGVATLGTALTDKQAKILQWNAETVILCYDADQAGQQAAIRGINLLKNNQCVIKVAQLPLGLDPDDYIRRFGESAFKEGVIGNPLSYTAFQLESLKKEYDLQDEDQRLKCIARSIKLIGELSRAVERDHYLRKLAEEFQVSIDALKEETRKWLRQKNKKSSSATNREQHFPPAQLTPNPSVSISEKAERYLIAHMMKSKSVTDWAKQHVGAEFHTEIYAALAAYLYTFYDQESKKNISHFIHSLPDQMLKSKASELAMIELPDEVSEEALQDYASQIRMAFVKVKIREKKRLMEQLSKRDPIQAAKISKEIVKLSEQLKRKEQQALS